MKVIEAKKAVGPVDPLPTPDESSPLRSPQGFLGPLDIKRDRSGNAWVVSTKSGSLIAEAVGSGKLKKRIFKLAQKAGVQLRRLEMDEISQQQRSYAEAADVDTPIWQRVAPIPGGIEIHVGDEENRRIRITAGAVEIITTGSTVIFWQSPASRALGLPAAFGDLKRASKYLNVSAVDRVLLIAWITYTIAHPKMAGTAFLILVLLGGQGTGKSSLCKNFLGLLIDPSRVGVQIMPNNLKDLAIAAVNSHCLFFDNLRHLSLSMSDALCVLSTGGSTSSRQLYTDSGQQILELHGALVLNGIHSFIEQPDLAQRCLPIDLLPIPEERRRSEAELIKELQEDLPVIQRGLYDLIAQIFVHLPEVEVTNPERMFDFVKWLAAMEKAQKVPPGVYQMAYSEAIKEGQLDSLLDNLLGSAILEFVDGQPAGTWTGTPTALLTELNFQVSLDVRRSREWPSSSISLSKRLGSLQASLRTQGISVEFTRGKHRSITINKEGAQHE